MPGEPISADIERACRRVDTLRTRAGAVGISQSLEVRPPVKEVAVEAIAGHVALGKDKVAVGVLGRVEVELVEQLDDGFRVRLGAHAPVEVADRREGHLVLALDGTSNN